MSSSVTSPTNSPGAKQLGLPNVAFVGKAGAGKSTAADLLLALGYRKLSFAQPLKDVAAELWGRAARTDRDKLQKLGVACREIDPDVWANLLGDRLRQPGATKPAVIDDCRFENEWFALKAEGFVIVRITAPRANRITRLQASGKWQDEEQLGHVSETAVDHLVADHAITNDGTTDELYDQIVEVLLKERKRR